MKSLIVKTLSKVIAVCFILMVSLTLSRAASDIWDGSTDGIWATSANWLTDPAAVPGTGDTATFNGAGNGFTTIDLGTGVTISNILFDTASVAAYQIGSGAVGSQTLILNNAGAIKLSSGVANNQLFNANLTLPTETNATTTIGNFSSSLLTIAGNLSAIPTNGNSLLTITNTGDVKITGVLTQTGAGNLALLKNGPGKLTVSTNAVWSGSGALVLLCYVESMIFGGNVIPQQGQDPIKRINHGCIACKTFSHVTPEVFFRAQVNHHHK